eukprot:TRINITY_DN2965_c0_g1_i4.p2 TRINITY_DN2965_c0_g1~~TRINITY_DN2965_c0_g1_i4.p2  ORF type:complete len:764 (-),score=161.39 TRINITY_DN2965_c0_g1_i4:504-2795(-)
MNQIQQQFLNHLSDFIYSFRIQNQTKQFISFFHQAKPQFPDLNLELIYFFQSILSIFTFLRHLMNWIVVLLQTHLYQCRLLDIVAKSIYTDKDVFIRELLSNSSDALEKQRYLELTGKSKSIPNLNLEIEVWLDEKKKQIVLFDSGCGMNRQSLIDDLGTIARSGSQKFLENIKKTPNEDQSIADKIIGQFGVGFYSSFIVGDLVEVISKPQGQNEAYSWVSDGSGTFSISKVDNPDFERGTKIIISLRPDSQKFCDKAEIKKIIQRYSNFINFPISINGEQFNLIQAIWSRSKSEIKEEEYKQFWEYLANTKVNYQYKLHYTTDAPLSIKSLIYVPQTHVEKFGLQQEDLDVHLYSRKVLIKQKCKEILPNYFRFLKGVVDCEDLPLNISRENYQDSALMNKLKQVMTKRIIKLLQEEAESNPANYLKWYNEFQIFIKEGVAMDFENQSELLKLCRYYCNYTSEFITIQDYIKKMGKDQKKIYYLLGPSREHCLSSPYMEPFRDTEIPVLFLTIHIDEMVFRQLEKYQDFKFCNLENDFSELQKDLFKEAEQSKTDGKKPEEQKQQDQQKKKPKQTKETKVGVPEEDYTPFCLWIRNELQPLVTKVSVSKTLRDSPAIIVSNISSGMRQMMMMMDRQQNAQSQQLDKNFTFEINPKHELIVKLNKIRKYDAQTSSIITKQLLDNCMVTTGIQLNQTAFMDRINLLMNSILDNSIEKVSRNETVFQAQQPEREVDKHEEVQKEITLDKDGNPVVKDKATDPEK